MSINMTQDFVFETDDIKSFGHMLGSVATVLFKESGKYTCPFIQTENPGLFRDGKYDNYRRHDSGLLEMQDSCALVEPTATHGGATVYNYVRDENHCVVQTDDKDEAARMVCARREEPQPTRLFICTLGDYRNDANKDGAKKYRTIVDQVQDAVKFVYEFDVQRVERELQGRPFRQYGGDGTISTGYRMDYRPNGGWNLLDLSAIHVYYGK
tara:strand:- start:1138 stop:1770 length:633 start_codon:yes stop_codon:yes gene_type:complete